MAWLELISHWSFAPLASVALAHATAIASSSPFLWYVTRTMGVAAYVALSLSVILGMLRTVARKASERVSWVVDELHQFIATLSGVAVLGHLLALKFDDFLPFSFFQLILPFGETYKAFATALGVFALYGMVALLFSSWLRRRMRYSWWRVIHYLSFVTFGVVTAHGWLVGSDSGEPWMRAIYASATSAILFLILVRFFVGAPSVSASSSAS
jgi:predicted ferric reductase